MTEPAPERGPKTPSGHPVPFLTAILIADWAIREDKTGKYSLIGIFENIHALEFPCRHPTLQVYIKLTDAEGPYDLSLQLIRLDDATRLAEVRATAKAPDRMSVGELVFRLDQLVFPAPGLYEFRFLANDRFVGSKTFTVSLVKVEPSGG